MAGKKRLAVNTTGVGVPVVEMVVRRGGGPALGSSANMVVWGSPSSYRIASNRQSSRRSRKE